MKTTAAPKLTKRARSPRTWIFGISVLVLAALWLLVDWEWSTIDDPGLYLAAQSARESHGFLGGLIVRLNEAYNVDISWGLFRPGYWFYQAIVYQFPLPWPQLMRLFMVLVVLAGPTVYFARHGWQSTRLLFAFTLVLASSAPLMIGLEFVSLQELTGAAFIALGLLVKSRPARLLMWVIAALFKSPFAWIMFGEAIVLWRKGDRKWAVLYFVSPVLILFTAWFWSRAGTYTGNYELDPNLVWENIPKLFQAPIYFLFIITLWWATASRARLHVTDSTIVFGIAFAGYSTQMLPWSVTAYYVGPISFLLGLTLVSIVSEPQSQKMLSVAVSFIIPVLLAILMIAWPIRQVLQTNTVLRGISTCLEGATNAVVGLSGDLVYVTSSIEAPDRMMNNLQLRNPSWNGTIELDPNRDLLTSPEVSHYIVVGYHDPIATKASVAVCEAGIAKVYRFK